MNRKTFNNAVIVLILLVGGFVTAKSQSTATRFANGITVAIKTETVPPTGDNPAIVNNYTSGSGYDNNVLHRFMADTKNKFYFGYDILVEKQSDGGKFKLTIKPLSKSPGEIFRQSVNDYSGFTAKSLPKYPDPVLIDAGDAVTINLLENPQTKAKVFDIIKVSADAPNYFINFSERQAAKDFSINDVILRIDKPQISINGQKYTAVGGGATGNYIYIYIPKKGRFIFSFRPVPEYNFQKNGIILDNKILFDYNGEKYEIANKSSVLETGGKWNLWVYPDSNFQTEDDNYGFGAADEVKAFFDNR